MLSAALIHGLPPDKQTQVTVFQDWAESKHGTLLGLWRKLDKDGSMTVSKTEFLAGMKELGYPGKASLLWSVLDSDGTGILTITEFVPVSALHLARFKHWANEKFGSVQNAFHAFDHDHNGKMTIQEFIRGCHSEDFPVALKSSIQTLFDAMDDRSSGGKPVITSDEVRFIDSWKCPEYLMAEPDDAARAAFQEALVARHGRNHILAWRRALDKDGNMRLSFSEFTDACRRLAKHGMSQATPSSGVPALYCAFDRYRRGWISLQDWHETSWRLLANFRRWAHMEFPRVSHCLKAWDSNSLKGVSFGTFRTQVKELGMTADEMEYIFEGLSLQAESWSEEKGRLSFGRLTKAELVFLDTWNPDENQLEATAWDEQFRSCDIDH
jgi:Ca2+-binding EF-hand superfamily protein